MKAGNYFQNAIFMRYPIALVTHLESHILKPVGAHPGAFRAAPPGDDDFLPRPP